MMRCQNCGKSGHPAIGCKPQQTGGTRSQIARYTVNSGNPSKTGHVLMHQQQPRQLNQLNLFEAQQLAKRELQEAQLRYQQLKAIKSGSSGQQL